MFYFIDTNVFLRVLVREDEKIFRECRQILNLVRQNKIKAFISTLVLSEIDWVLESFYKFPKEKVVTGLSSVLKLKNLKVVDKVNPLLALELYEKFSVKFIDALISSIPAIGEGKMKIVSYDRDFDKLGDWRVEPKEIAGRG